MAVAIRIDEIDQLPSAPATDVKKLGWRQLMRTVAQRRRVVVTNHKEPEAVILSVDEYRAIIRALSEARGTPANETALDALRRRFDERMAAVDDSGEPFRTAMAAPVRLGGKLRAGEGY